MLFLLPAQPVGGVDVRGLGRLGRKPAVDGEPQVGVGPHPGREAEIGQPELEALEQLQRLRTLKELLERFDCGLSDVAFAKRLREQDELQAALDGWFDAPARRPQGVSSADWLSWEQEKHQRLLALAEAA